MIAFNHVSMNCRDVAAQERFYVKHFGFQRSRTFRPGKPNQLVMLKLGSVRLELHPIDPANADQKGGEQSVGFKHLAFDAPKLELAIESLRTDGIEPDPVIDISKHIPGCRVVFFRDPEGNVIELMEGYYDEK
jgi:glyoxylase I family protein